MSDISPPFSGRKTRARYTPLQTRSKRACGIGCRASACERGSTSISLTASRWSGAAAETRTKRLRRTARLAQAVANGPCQWPRRLPTHTAAAERSSSAAQVTLSALPSTRHRIGSHSLPVPNSLRAMWLCVWPAVRHA